jgi:hypothetical protein
MDVIIAFVFLLFGAVALVLLYFSAWVCSFALLFRPKWIGDRIVLRFWPERTVDYRALRHYRMFGLFMLFLSILVTIPPILRVLGR